VRYPRQSGIALATALLILLLISSMVLGLTWLVMTDQNLGGNMSSREQAFYGAEAGMEKLTADLGNLFSQNYAPSGAQVNALVTSPFGPPIINGVQYLTPTGTLGYQIAFPPDNKGNPLAQNHTIKSGTYQGLIGLLTPYTLTVTARTVSGSEVKFQRNVETVGIPVFQFGIFSQTDLSFFAGPNFAFGGRVHTNGNLFLAEGNGNTVTMSNKVTAVGEVIRTNLSNGWNTNTNYTGTVKILNVPNGNTYSDLLVNQGSLVGTLGSGFNEPTWHQVSLGTFNGNLQNGRTGAKTLTLTIATPALGGTPIDLIRRPIAGEDVSAPGKLGERYFAQASMKILLSDNKLDIMNLPCVNAGTQPVDLSTLGVPLGSLPGWYTAGIPLPISNAGGPNYNPADGYWIANGKPIITGFLKIEIQTAYGVPCGTWKDVTREILNLGLTGRNLNPQGAYIAPPAAPALPPFNTGRDPSACPDPSPNAVIRLARLRDNPSTSSPGGGCGTTSTLGTDYWPNVFFDPREGNPRDNCPLAACNVPTFGGTMHYVELDVNNLVRWLTGAIGASGTQAKDLSISPNDFSIYFSDRRTNFTAAPIPGGWPPASPSGNETGEYGFGDFANPPDQFGCPNGVMDTGEDLDGVGGAPLTYGQTPVLPANLVANAPAFTANPHCNPAPIWPYAFYSSALEARENPPLFFRRALKLVNGGTINLGVCPSSVNCGLTVASENPVYVQGNYNSPGGGFNPPYGAAAVVADAFTFLSNNWNDVNSFSSPYSTAGRAGNTTWFRLAVAAGKGISFPQPTTYPNPQDFGTDGGTHNFLRYIEGWGGTLNFRGSIISFYYNRQAVGLYKCCATVYSPPTRGYNFDTDFLTPALLPPRTPMFRDVNTIGFTQLLLPNQ